MSLAAGGAVALAVALDRTLSEPPSRIHPVAWLGRVVDAVDGRTPDARVLGVAVAVAVPVAVAGLAAGTVLTVATVDERLAAVAAGGILFVCTSHRKLIDVASDVVARSTADIDTARDRLPALAGRDAATLTPGQVRSAAVESAAENLADGLIAPLLAFGAVAIAGEAVGLATGASLAIAAAAAGWVKAVNTLDSMLGYEDRAAGWGPARLDDAVMWVPARFVALLIVVVGRPGAVIHTLRRTRSSARIPASPNSGWPMAAIAAVLDVRLEKPGAYVLFEAEAHPSADEARAGVGIVSRAGWLGIGVVGAVVAI